MAPRGTIYDLDVDTSEKFVVTVGQVSLLSLNLIVVLEKHHFMASISFFVLVYIEYSPFCLEKAAIRIKKLIACL